ncbi:hypothetical protein WR25_12954 [Diploscapter pachys]|uniref:Ground-like domain-containing protein n=1 Tax=Diploscapter pachys TaxID=2018661 RepID=A0A2A2K2Z3_9BILA|nr:hypothetical protein WR25_12954 [Diploscapter pachys]
MLIFVVISCFVNFLAEGFLFPSSGNGCCSPCPPPPVCAPVNPCPPMQIQMCQPAPVAQTQTCCTPMVSSCGTGCKKEKMKRMKRGITNFRDKRQSELVEVGDAKCNSDDLKNVIIQNIDRVTSIAKKRIQLEAERILGGRYNVICARGDFSYITSTMVYCQHTVGDVTCYVFKQLSDSSQRRMV